MKKVLFVFGLMISFFVNAQTPIVQWKRVLGGTRQDILHSIKKTFKNGFIFTGETQSNDGDVVGLHNSTISTYSPDIWVLELDSVGNKIWSKCFGGSAFDVPFAIIQTRDSNYLVGGTTHSNDYDVKNNYGSGDCWLAKISKNGSIIWSKNYGGTNSDVLLDIVETDNSYVFISNSNSNDSDVVFNNGSYDLWICRVDYAGNIIWNKNYGGSSFDYPQKIIKTLDNGYLIVGYTFSNDSINYMNHGTSDIWILKLDSLGNTIWQKNYGGSKEDFANSVIENSDSSFVVLATTNSNDFDVSNNFGNQDIWVLKINKNGSIIWEKSFGGILFESASSIEKDFSNNYFICGRTSSSYTGNVNSNNQGGYDNWVIKIDTSGNILWQNTFGGSKHEGDGTVIPLTDTTFLLATSTGSNDGDIGFYYGTNFGHSDIWIAKYSLLTLLEVKLLSFNLTQTPNNVLLNWQTQNEINISHINIQRSNNGKDFTTIGKVNAKCCEYEYTDNITRNEKQETLYYKLEIVEKDGTKTYSEIKQITRKEKQETFKIFPNPSKGNVTIECSGVNEIVIIDILGKTIQQFNHLTPNQTINTKQLNKGIYFIKATLQNGETKTEKLIVE